MKRAIVGFVIFLGAVQASNAPESPQLRKLNVVVTDDKGKPVTGLLVSDFFVLEDGRPRQVLFSRFTGRKATMPNPGEYSNRTAAMNPTVILIDLLNDRRVSDTVVAKQIGAYLKRVESADDLYLYLLTRVGELYPIRAIGEPWAPNAGAALDAAIKKFAVFKPADDIDLQLRFNFTSSALQKVDSQMRQITGRKNLVWVTHGVPIIGTSLSGKQLDFTDATREVAEHLALSQIAVYGVEQAVSGAGEDVGTDNGRMIDSMTSVTGGRRYRTDRSSEAIQQARADSLANYEIVYSSVAAPADFTKRAFEAAAQNPNDVTEIGMKANTSAIRSQTMRFDLRIATEDLLLRQPRDRVVGRVSVLFAAYDGEKLVQASRPIPLDVNLTEQQYEAAAHGAIEFHQEIPIAANIVKVRAIVVDGDRAAVGSVTIPIPR